MCDMHALYSKRYQSPVRKLNGGHFSIQIGNRQVTAGATPSDSRALRNTDQDVRRALRDQGMVEKAKEINLYNKSFDTTQEHAYFDKTLGRIVSAQFSDVPDELPQEYDSPATHAIPAMTSGEEHAQQQQDDDMSASTKNNTTKTLKTSVKLPEDLYRYIQDCLYNGSTGDQRGEMMVNAAMDTIDHLVPETFRKDTRGYRDMYYELNQEMRTEMQEIETFHPSRTRSDIIRFGLRLHMEKAKAAPTAVNPEKEAEVVMQSKAEQSKVEQPISASYPGLPIYSAADMDRVTEMFPRIVALHKLVMDQDDATARRSAMQVIYREYGVDLKAFLVSEK